MNELRTMQTSKQIKKINRKTILLLLLSFQIAACQNKPNKQALELLQQANSIGLKSNYTNLKDLDNGLRLINKAIELDNEYFDAYSLKTTFLTAQKDIDELILNNEKIIELRPDQPVFLIQRGFFFDIKGDKFKAGKNYEKGLLKYEELLKTKLNYDFELRMAYLTALETNGDFKKAELEMERMFQDFPDNEILKVYKAEYKFKTKEELIQFWKNGGKD